MNSEEQAQEQAVEATGHRKQVLPGPFPPRRVPPPIEAVCVQVEKIYDACSQKRCAEVEFRIKRDDKRDDDNPGDKDRDRVRDRVRARRIVDCTTSDFKAKCELSEIDDDPPLVRANVEYSYKVTVVWEDERGRERTETQKVEHEKSVVLFGTGEMFCKVEAVLECLGCDIVSPTRIFCEIGEFIVIKSALEVQLLIPSYGFCPAPPECEELPTRCEAFLEAPPPPLFPPQPWDVED